MNSQNRKFSDIITDLSLVWPKWNKLNTVTIDDTKPSSERLYALQGQEDLVRERYKFIRELDDFIEHKTKEEN